MKKWVCTVCGYIYEGEEPPEKCPVCGVNSDKFVEKKDKLDWADEHHVGSAKGIDEELVEDLREEFDYILLDCPAGIEQGFRNAIAGADRALIVTTPEVSAIRDADRIIGLLEASGVGRMDLIINRIRSDMVRRGDMMSVDDVMDILSVPVIGTVPDDEDIVISTNQGEPLVGMNGYAGQAYLNICKRILGESVPFIQLDASPGFWSRISGFLKRA